MRPIDEELFEACESWGASPAKIRKLLAKGANPNAKNDERETPLHAAAQSNVAALATILIDAGAKVDAKDERGRTPAFDWAYSGDAKGMSVLLAHGAKVNTKDDDGTTPLHMAARSENLATAEVLIAAGADLRAQDGAKHTPEDTARSLDRLKMLALLAKHGGADASVDMRAYAKDIGMKAARSAWDSGDWETYEREPGLDPSDLQHQYWLAHYVKLVKDAVRNAKQKATPQLMSELETLYHEGWAAEMKPARKKRKKKKPSSRRSKNR
jgi:ankyrin repeat protein